MNGATIGVRAFQQQIDDQLVTVFGLRPSDDVAAAAAATTAWRGRRCRIRGLSA